jgi:7-cyano-7-deazaguanine synthase
MDSSICLALAISEFGARNVLSVGFDYGQRHASELAAAQRICTAWQVDRTVLDLACLGQVKTNALVNAAVSIQDDNTLVVGRNGLMAHVATVHAAALGAQCLMLGVIECDAATTGYRDCSRPYWNTYEQLARLDLNQPTFSVRTPLVHMTKKETMALADSLGILAYLLQETISCYEGLPGPGCTRCHSCRLRAQGLAEYQKGMHGTGQ